MSATIVHLRPKPSLHALRKAGWAVLNDFANDRKRRRELFNEIVRIAYDEPTPPDRNPEIRTLTFNLACTFEQPRNARAA